MRGGSSPAAVHTPSSAKKAISSEALKGLQAMLKPQPRKAAKLNSVSTPRAGRRRAALWRMRASGGCTASGKLTSFSC